jgi:ATP-dependent DNA helicase 2 subunit 1
MKEITSSLVMKGYSYERYPNPKLQWFYRVLQAQALDEELPSTAIDATIPKYKSINAKAGDKIVAFNDELAASTRDLPVTSAPAKRERVPNTDSPPQKKMKSSDDVLSKLSLSNIRRFNLSQLKEWSAANGLEVDGTKKADYCQAIEAYLTKHAQQ